MAKRLAAADRQLAPHGDAAHQPALMDKLEIELVPLDETADARTETKPKS
jgi:hypothetical protein